MNPYELKGIDFLDKIVYLVERKDLKTKDSLFKVLDQIKLKEGVHLGLKVAGRDGLGDESYFYTYYGKVDPFKDYGEPPHEVFKNIIVEPSEMGAWQAYLLWMSPTVLPLFWHGGYIRRDYFFDRDDFECPSPWEEDNPIELKLEQIPQPSVTLEGNKAIVTCPYWNNWEGLVLESMPIIFKSDGGIAIRRAKHKVLMEYNCRICY